MFRFTIRDLIWLTIVVIMAVVWWIDRGRLWGDAYGLSLENEQLEIENTDLRSHLQKAHAASRPANP